MSVRIELALLVLLGCLALFRTPLCIAQTDYAPLVEGVLSAWSAADLVCLGEDHGSKQDSDLRIALVNNPQFPRIVRLIGMRPHIAWSGSGFRVLVREEDASAAHDVLEPPAEHS